MRIIFKNAEEKKKVIGELANTTICPRHFGLKEECMPFIDKKICEKCWENALKETEVEE